MARSYWLRNRHIDGGERAVREQFQGKSLARMRVSVMIQIKLAAKIK